MNEGSPRARFLLYSGSLFKSNKYCTMPRIAPISFFIDGKPGGLSHAAVIAMVVVSCVLIVGLGILGFSMWQRRKSKRQLTEIAQKCK